MNNWSRVLLFVLDVLPSSSFFSSGTTAPACAPRGLSNASSPRLDGIASVSIAICT